MSKPTFVRLMPGELLSLIGKAAVVYVQDFQDPL
jgi:hypothetical protein